MSERQLTDAPGGHLLTNAGVWTCDGRWIVYDVRSTPDGSVFDGRRIERVEVDTGRVEVLYESVAGACCGVATASPVDERVVFIRGPQHPTQDWSYGPARREGVVVRTGKPGRAENLDARDVIPPFTAGALRGGSHVHVFSPDGRLVSFTYEDAVLEAHAGRGGEERNLRAVGVSLCGRRVTVPPTHPRNHNGTAFSVLVSRLTDEPRPGSDEISRAEEEGWIGRDGYDRTDGSRCRYALACQGHVVTDDGRGIREVYVIDLPDDPLDLARAGHGPLAGTAATRPAPPHGVSQRRVTFTADRPHPGLQGPRHWLRSSPDGTRIACLMRDQRGVVQVYTVSPRGGDLCQLTDDPWDVASAFTWSPDGTKIACVRDASVMTIDTATGAATRLTRSTHDGTAPRPEACVFSPDGGRIAFLRTVPSADGRLRNQIFVVDA